jgi:hypothetical protein
MRLRQVALVAAELEPAAEALCDVFGLAVGYRDPGVAKFGLANVVIPIGDTFLEVVSPIEDQTTAGRFLERRGGDGGYMVILQLDDLDRKRSRLRELGVRVVWQADHPSIRGTHLHPKDVGGAILSLDDALPPESWEWAGPSWRDHIRTEVVSELVGVEIAAEDPARMAARWAEVLERDMQVLEGNALVRLDRGVLRFAPIQDQRGEGVSAVELRVRDRAAIEARARARGMSSIDGSFELLGTRFELCD